MAGTTYTVEEADGSAAIQADLWGERARDWADVLEGWSGWGIPIYRHILERVPVGTGTRLLDVGGKRGDHGLRPARAVRIDARLRVAGQLLPSQPAGEQGHALHEEGVLEALACEARLKPREAGYVDAPEEYRDLETMLRGYLAVGPIVRAVRALGEQAVRDTLTEALRSLRTSAGGVRLEDELRYLIAVA